MRRRRTRRARVRGCLSPPRLRRVRLLERRPRRVRRSYVGRRRDQSIPPAFPRRLPRTPQCHRRPRGRIDRDCRLDRHRDDQAANSGPVGRKRVPRAAGERAANRNAPLPTPYLQLHSRKSRRRPLLVGLRSTSSLLDLPRSRARFNADRTGNPQDGRRSTTAGSVRCFRGGYGIGGRGRTLVERSVLAQSDFARPRTFSGLGWSWFSRNRSDGRAGARAGITRSPASTGLKV